MKKYLLPNDVNWYRANMHCHTTVSDGHYSPEEIKKAYKEMGYSIVAYTDHEIIRTHNDLTDDEFLAITSSEFSINDCKPCFEIPEGEYMDGWKSKKVIHLGIYAKDKNNMFHPATDEGTFNYWKSQGKDMTGLALERCTVVVVTYKTSRLQLVYEFVLAGQFPVKGYGILFVVPPTVEPDRTDIAILGEQFGQLGIHEVIVLLPVGIVTSLAALCACTSHGIIVAHPVDVAIIEVQAYALLATGLGQFLQNVLAVGCGLHDVELALLGVPHGETIVMTCGKADVLGTCRLYGTHPFTCIIPVGIESIRHLGILIAVGHCILQVPFALGKHTVDTPMQEDTQLHVTEFLTRAQIGLGGNILCLCLDARESAQGQKD